MCKYKCFIELRNTKDYQKDKKFANDRFTVTMPDVDLTRNVNVR